MRVLHVTPSFYPAWAYGGIPCCAYELCRALVESGDEVVVWTTDACDAYQRLTVGREVVHGVVVRRFANLSNRLAYGRQLYLPRGLLAAARREIGEFDLVHIHSHRHLLEVVMSSLARRHGIPYVLTGNGTVPPIERYVWIKRALDVLGLGAIPARAAACIAVSQAEVAHYRAAGVDAARIHVIPNGIRPEEFADLPRRGAFRAALNLGDGPLIVFVGKITPRKGVDVLLRALALLPPSVRLVVAGNFMMPQRPFRRLVKGLQLGDRVRFPGLLLGAQRNSAYVDADVVAYPSSDEIFGLVAAEALMCGAPVVVCDDSGCGEVVRAAGGGLLVPYGDVEALAAALLQLLEDRVRREQLVAAGRRYVAENLSWQSIAGRTRSLYRAVLRASGAPEASR